MNDAWFDSILAWISAHPVAAGAVIFLIAFLDSLVIVGIVVPAMPLLFAVGALIGLGHIDGSYAIACAAAGAFSADAVSYWVGRRWGPQMRELWAFRRYPQLLDRGETLFRRHGVKSILVARFVGAVRPFVPAIAGMLRMRLRRYLPVSAVAAVAWAAVFLAPGWIFGASYDAVAAVADRLALVLVALLAVLALVWAGVLYVYRWFDMRANDLLARAIRWTRARPRLGRYAEALIDPRRPESPSLAILAVLLIGIGWAWFALMTTVLMRDEPLALDQNVYEFMTALRNPLADRLMAGLASIGDAAVLVPAAALAMLWLAWRRRWMAVAHWLAALGFGVALTALLEAVISMPSPPTAHGGFGFPSMSVTMATITFGFFAVLIARELPGRSRVWPYLVSGVVATLLGFARIYLGAHWLSDVVGGMLLGIVWLLALGIGYRSHVNRSFWMRPLAAIFYLTFAAAALWHAPRAVDPMLANLTPPPPTATLAPARWWDDGWRTLPSRRNERDLALRWPLDVQVAGPLQTLQAHLEARGWTAQPQADWIATLGLLDDDIEPPDQPVLPATLDTEAETLLLRRQVSPERAQVLRLWRAPVALDDGTPLWVGSVQTLHHTRPFNLFALWQPRADGHAAWEDLREAVRELDARAEPHPQSGLPVLRLRTM
ncbi:MAG: VTT domain-containing protein [Luteimonas sp.]